MIEDPTPRRKFLGQLALTTAGLSGVTRVAAATPALERVAKQALLPTEWDDSWTSRLGTTHRFVFDLPEENKASLIASQAGSLYDDYHAALNTKDQDVHVVVVIRHGAIALAFDNALWTRYTIGSANPSKELLGPLQTRGAIFLACNVALMNRVRQFARSSGQDEATVEADVRANLLPGVIPQVNGVYAVHRAQDAGCVLYHVGS